MRRLYYFIINQMIIQYFHHLLGNAIKKYAHLAMERTLDIGCGDKPYQVLFPKVTELIGTNSAEYYNELDQIPSETDVVCDDGTKLPFQNDEFDTVLNFQVLPVFQDMDAFFQEVNRVLKDDGVFFLSTDFLYPIWNAPNNFWRTTSYGLKLLADRNLFEVLAIEPLGGYYAMKGRLLVRFLRTKMACQMGKVKSSKGFTKLFHIFWLLVVILRTLTAPLWVNICLLAYSILDKVEFDDDFTTGYLIILRKKKDIAKR
ncbi:MAG: class I SAM-dependent methyltransferase [Candidatus Cloacimonetes bacterium]|nr:class I SAM-dependent methyltransferase [Candidatus Cloacimonadota bacterium]